MARDADDPVVVGYTLAHYGTLLRVDGDASRACALHAELLTISRSLGEENLRAEAHYDLAMDAMSTDDLASAESHLTAALCQFRTMDYLDGLARCVSALSALALKREHPHLAARFIGTAAAVRASTGLRAWPAVAETERRTISRAAALLPSGEFAAQVSSGRTQTIEDAITQAC